MARFPRKAGCFVLEGLNIYAACYYFNYLFFHMRAEFGFGNRENLLLAALNGFLYTFVSWFAGKFAQRRGYFTALYLGFGIMALALAVGVGVNRLAGQIGIMLVWTFGICFTWPTLEALASEGETRAGLTRSLGIYNLVWAGGAAVAYFTGGALLELLGRRSLFWLPATLHLIQLAVTWQWHRAVNRSTARGFGRGAQSAPAERSPRSARRFLRLAWLVNPFAYVAMNTFIPWVPDLAAKLGLSTVLVGIVASVWMFARLAAFAALWRWSGWHYQFRWLAGAYAAMVLSFVALLLAPNLAVLVMAQIIFGLAVGLIYYSSLFYSMDVGLTKGEHGGFHEALIGAGLFGGPAVAAAALHFLPAAPHAGVWAVGGVLCIGGVALCWRRARGSGDEARWHDGGQDESESR